MDETREPVLAGIDPRKERRVVTVRRVVRADRQRIFDLLADPGRHAELDGSGTVRGAPDGPRRARRTGA